MVEWWRERWSYPQGGEGRGMGVEGGEMRGGGTWPGEGVECFIVRGL